MKAALRARRTSDIPQIANSSTHRQRLANGLDMLSLHMLFPRGARSRWLAWITTLALWMLLGLLMTTVLSTSSIWSTSLSRVMRPSTAASRNVDPVSAQSRSNWSTGDWSAFFDVHAPVKSQSSLSATSKNRHVRLLDTLLTPLLVPRNPGDPGHASVRNFIVDTLTALNFDVQLDKFTDSTPYNPLQEFTNIIATKHPNATRRLVLSAHYDSKNVSSVINDNKLNANNADMSGATFIGATDSSVPCAILLEVATLLNSMLESAAATTTPETTLQLIFFDGEEAQVAWSEHDSLYGSRHLANKWAQPSTATIKSNNGSANNNPQESTDSLSQISLLVLLDLLGAPNPIIPNYGLLGSSLRHMLVNSVSTQSQDENSDPFLRLLRIQSQLHDAQLLFRIGDIRSSKISEHMEQSSPPQTDASFDSGYLLKNGVDAQIDDDHRPFMKYNVPVLHLIPLRFPNVWHKLEDNGDSIAPEVVVNFARMMTVFTKEYLDL